MRKGFKLVGSENPNLRYISIFTTIFMFATIVAVAYINPSILGFIEDLGGPIIAAILFVMPIVALYSVPVMKKLRNKWLDLFVLVTGILTITSVVYKFFRFALENSQMDLQMRGIVIGFVLLLNIANADYTGRLPNAITLQGGEPQTHSAIMDCSSYWECVFGDFAYNFTYSTKGNTNSNLTLNGTLPPNPTSQKQGKPFFIGNMTINPHSNLIMQGFESFNLGASLNINGGSLEFHNGNFATLFGTNISVSNGGKLGVRAANGFTNRGNMSANNATISIKPTSARNYGNIYNNNGDITIGTNLYNIGQKTALAGASPSSVANIINNGGKLTIQGNLYNGGQENPNFDCRVSGCGGGNITNNGGEIIIQGQLTSQAKDGQPSSITIKGGNLTATGGVQNLAGSTLTIGADNSGKMGQLIVGGGQKINNSGEIIVDLMGMNAGIIKPFIDTNGNSSSLITGNTQISIRNGNSDFANASGFDNASGTINFIINQNAINHFKTTLNNNESATLARFDELIYTISGASSANLKSSANDINRAIFSAFLCYKSRGNGEFGI